MPILWLGRLGSPFGGSATGAPSVEVDPLPSDLELAFFGYAITQAYNRILSGVGVDDGLALDADQIDVGFHVRFVPRHLLEGQFLNQATPL